MKDACAKDLYVPISDYPHIDHSATVKDAFMLLDKSFEKSKEYRTILVVDEHKRLKGVLSIRDLIRAIEPSFLKTTPSSFEGLAAEFPALTLVWQELFVKGCGEECERPVSQAMAKVEIAVKLDDPLAKVAYLMVKHFASVLPVVEQDTVIGVVRLIDVFRSISDVILRKP